MPIVSRELTHIHLQTNGTVRVQEVLTDQQGRIWRHSYTAASEAAATTDMNARDMTERLKDADFRDLLIWIQEKNDSDDFDFTGRDLTLLEGEEQLLIWFATNLGGDAISVAWWIEDMTPPIYEAIRDRVGYDVATGAKIQDRAIALLGAEVSFDAVEETP